MLTEKDPLEGLIFILRKLALVVLTLHGLTLRTAVGRPPSVPTGWAQVLGEGKEDSTVKKNHKNPTSL